MVVVFVAVFSFLLPCASVAAAPVAAVVAAAIDVVAAFADVVVADVAKETFL